MLKNISISRGILKFLGCSSSLYVGLLINGRSFQLLLTRPPPSDTLNPIPLEVLILSPFPPDLEPNHPYPKPPTPISRKIFSQPMPSISWRNSGLINCTFTLRSNYTASLSSQISWTIINAWCSYDQERYRFVNIIELANIYNENGDIWVESEMF